MSVPVRLVRKRSASTEEEERETDPSSGPAPRPVEAPLAGTVFQSRLHELNRGRPPDETRQLALSIVSKRGAGSVQWCRISERTLSVEKLKTRGLFLRGSVPAKGVRIELGLDGTRYAFLFEEALNALEVARLLQNRLRADFETELFEVGEGVLLEVWERLL